jgi:hypothetical protein
MAALAAVAAMLAGLAGVVHAPARASVMAVPKATPPQGYTTLDRHGCPIYHPGSGGKIAAFGDGGPTTTLLKHGQHCVALPTTVFTLTNTSGGRCAALTIVEAAYPKGIGPIAAVVYSTVGEGTRWWEQPVNSITGTGPGTGAGETTSFGDISYKVPKGYYAWQVGGGSGPDPCGPSPKLDGWAAWGITAKDAISGVVTCKSSCEGRSGIDVSVVGPTKTSAITDRQGQYVVLVRRGSYRVTPKASRWTFDPHHRSVDVKTSSVTHVDFTGTRH